MNINKNYKVDSAEIMVVDDSNFNLRLLSETLLSAGYDVTTFKNGLMALTYIKSNKPDLILLDVNMPEMDGYEVCRLLKANKSTSDIPVIFVSALIDVNDKINGFKAGGIDFISKPFYPEEVVIRVKTHLKMEKLQKQLTLKNSELENALISLKKLQVHLVQEAKMASVGQLSAGIAHEINNPLGFISSNFSTLKKYMDKFKENIFEYRELKNILDECDSKSIADKIERINSLEEKNKINYILDDLKDLYKDTEDGLNRISTIISALKNFAHEIVNDCFEDYNINQAIEYTLALTKNEFTADIEIKLNLFENIPLIKAKTNGINQVLLSIILNSSYAIKENPKIKGQLNITTWLDDKFVYCSIEDNGVGIPEEYINKIFDPFFTTKPIGNAVGLGLSISYDIIVNKHKGQILCNSKMGKGTKITLLLPLYR